MIDSTMSSNGVMNAPLLTGVPRDGHAQGVEDAVRHVLVEMGEDPTREGLQDTPRRVRAMLEEITSGIGRDPADALSVEFHENYQGIMLVRDIQFYSLCEHHLLPFFGVAHVVYQPADGVLTGLSKLARVVAIASHRPQVQERITQEVADALERRLHPQGVFVSIAAEHLCMAMRGVGKAAARTITVVATGTLAAGTPQHQALLTQLQGGGGVR